MLPLPALVAATLLTGARAAPPASTWPAPEGLDLLSPLTSCAQAREAGVPEAARICGWKRASDVVAGSAVLVGGGAALAYTLTDGAGRTDLAAEPGVAWGVGLLATLGTTQVVKTRALRPRPYTWSDRYVAPARECGGLAGADREDCWSFFSGHTALTAYNLYSAASAFDLYHATAAWKPGAEALGYSLATVGTVFVGTARVRAGQHFWSDVAVGAVVGAGIGIAAPRLAQLLPGDPTEASAADAAAGATPVRLTLGAAW